MEIKLETTVNQKIISTTYPLGEPPFDELGSTLVYRLAGFSDGYLVIRVQHHELYLSPREAKRRHREIVEDVFTNPQKYMDLKRIHPMLISINSKI